MKESAAHAHGAAVSVAVRDSVVNGIAIKKGQYIGLVEDKIVYAGDDLESVTLDTVKLAAEDAELISIYYGCDLEEATAQKIASLLETAGDEWEVEVFDGGQPLYPLVMVIE